MPQRFVQFNLLLVTVLCSSTNCWSMFCTGRPTVESMFCAIRPTVCQRFVQFDLLLVNVLCSSSYCWSTFSTARQTIGQCLFRSTCCWLMFFYSSTYCWSTFCAVRLTVGQCLVQLDILLVNVCADRTAVG